MRIAAQQPKQENVHKQNMEERSPMPSETKMDIPMTTKQKEAAMCLISYFGGYNDDIETNPKTNEMVYALSYQASIYFQIHNFPEMLPGAMSRNSDPDKMLDTVMTIQDRQYKEFLGNIRSFCCLLVMIWPRCPGRWKHTSCSITLPTKWVTIKTVSTTLLNEAPCLLAIFPKRYNKDLFYALIEQYSCKKLMVNHQGNDWNS